MYTTPFPSTASTFCAHARSSLLIDTFPLVALFLRPTRRNQHNDKKYPAQRADRANNNLYPQTPSLFPCVICGLPLTSLWIDRARACTPLRVNDVRKRVSGALLSFLYIIGHGRVKILMPKHCFPHGVRSPLFTLPRCRAYNVS